MSGGRAIADYKEAERQYVIEGKSVRAICRDMGLKSWSGMNAVANREDWPGKRAAYLSAIARRSYEVSAATIADQRKEITDEAVLAGRATIRKYLNQLKDDKVHVSPKDAQIWAAFLLSEVSEIQPSSTEAPNVRNVTPPDAELLRRVLEAARERVAPAGSVGPTALVESSDPRPN